MAKSDIHHHDDLDGTRGDSEEGPYVSHCGVRWLSSPPVVRLHHDGGPKTRPVSTSRPADRVLNEAVQQQSELAALNPVLPEPFAAPAPSLVELYDKERFDKGIAPRQRMETLPDADDDVFLPHITLHGHGFAGDPPICGRCQASLPEAAEERARADAEAAAAAAAARGEAPTGPVAADQGERLPLWLHRATGAHVEVEGLFTEESARAFLAANGHQAELHCERFGGVDGATQGRRFVAMPKLAAAPAPTQEEASPPVTPVAPVAPVATDAMPLVIVRPSGERVAVEGRFSLASGADFCRANGHCPDLAVVDLDGQTTLISRWPEAMAMIEEAKSAFVDCTATGEGSTMGFATDAVGDGGFKDCTASTSRTPPAAPEVPDLPDPDPVTSPGLVELAPLGGGQDDAPVVAAAAEALAQEPKDPPKPPKSKKR